MTFRKQFLFFIFFVCQFALAQNDSIQYLEEVKVSDSQLKNFSNSQSVQQLSDSIINNSQASLTSLLNYNTVIYFKENGLGMVSSPSFRGTTAQQTAVIWNGININSQLNGQTDFNTITTKDFNTVNVRAGGGSSIYGSSAIGGSIHLNNDLSFKDNFSNDLELNYGSFNTFGLNYKLNVSDEKFSFQGSISRNSSDNDYKYLNTDRKNLNGQFYNNSFNSSFGYKINATNFLKFYSQFYDGERHFSLVTPSDSKTKYTDFNTRNLLEWSSFLNQFTSRLKVAFLSEEYRYFENITSDDFFFGKVETFIAKYDLTYDVNEKIKINTILDFTQNKGNGSDIQSDKRQIGSASLFFKHLVTTKLQYELSVRKEVTSTYESPVLFSAGANYRFTNFYALKVNGSRNFRIPTFNDLYWQGAGNPDLKPESSFQGEIGNEFRYKNFTFTANFYHIKIEDMIRWLPGNGGMFKPQNTNKVSIYGAEAILNWNKKTANSVFDFNGTYAYTNSKNDETGYQLTFVPYHKMTASFGYSYKKINAFYQHLFTGEVFTQTDNNPDATIEMYNVSNIGVGYGFGKKNSFTIGFKVLNLWNEEYESVENRPLPGRNYNLNLTLNF
ncbi:TonB-dependent receptor plug domain-containing protein [Flavobacterium soli]|uniref:TonB-dependent receptor plug domain-containing protein n=1 Tax=Flavobacterium soli TaxID=344881 RepID=UPI000424C58D|nr:TonB-dependent receptor [Flavobacterium soli]